MRALVTVNYSTFAILWVLVLWFHEDMFDGLISFEMYLDAILTTCLFNTFGDAFSVWDDYLSYGSFVSWCIDGWIVALVVDVVVTTVVCACAVAVVWIAGASILPVVMPNLMLYPFCGPGGVIAFA